MTILSCEDVALYASSPYAAWQRRHGRRGSKTKTPLQELIREHHRSVEVTMLESLRSKPNIVDLSAVSGDERLTQTAQALAERAPWVLQGDLQVEDLHNGVTLFTSFDALEWNPSTAGYIVIVLSDSYKAEPSHIMKASYCHHLLSLMQVPCDQQVMVRTTGTGDHVFPASDFCHVVQQKLSACCQFHKVPVTAEPPEKPLPWQGHGEYYADYVKSLQDASSLDLLPDIKEIEKRGLISCQLGTVDKLAGCKAYPQAIARYIPQRVFQKLQARAAAITNPRRIDPPLAGGNRYNVLDIIYCEKQDKFLYIGRCKSSGPMMYDKFQHLWLELTKNVRTDETVFYFGLETRERLLQCAERAGHQLLQEVVASLYGTSMDGRKMILRDSQRYMIEDSPVFRGVMVSHSLRDVVLSLPEVFQTEGVLPDLSQTAEVAGLWLSSRKTWQSTLVAAVEERTKVLQTICNMIPQDIAGHNKHSPMHRHLADWCRNNNKLDEDGALILKLCLWHERENLYLLLEAAELLRQQEEEWKDHIHCLYGLRLVGHSVRPTGNRFGDTEIVVDYEWDVEQELKFREGKTNVHLFQDVTLRAAVERIDYASKSITLMYQQNKFHQGRRALDHRTISVADSGFVPEGGKNRLTLNLVKKIKAVADCPSTTLRKFLHRTPPASLERVDNHSHNTDSATLRMEKIQRAVGQLKSEVLGIQGPPGCGKTWASARIIENLVKNGKSVLVSSNSHAAILNLLEAIEKVPCYKVKAGNEDKKEWGPNICEVKQEEVVPRCHPVVGSTVFGTLKFAYRFDYLFVDEAGQVPLANLVALSAAADNIVLVGDQMQLKTPMKDGVHSGDSGKSILEYLVGDVRIIEGSRGFLLPETRRMHPAITRFISSHFYEGQLTCNACTTNNRLILSDGVPRSGIAYKEVSHVGNAQTAPEEVQAVLAICKNLLLSSQREGSPCRVCISDSCKKVLGPEDVLVVAPYNAHVSRLKENFKKAEPPLNKVRIGTVDLFQGQEAPIVIVSLGSSAASAGRLDFLLNPNRLNVAVSRAQALAIVVASPALKDSAVTITVEQQRNLNTLHELISQSPL